MVAIKSPTAILTIKELMDVCMYELTLTAWMINEFEKIDIKPKNQRDITIDGEYLLLSRAPGMGV